MGRGPATTATDRAADATVARAVERLADHVEPHGMSVGKGFGAYHPGAVLLVLTPEQADLIGPAIADTWRQGLYPAARTDADATKTPDA